MKFSEEIIGVFDYLGEKMGIAIDWTSSNVMPYLQELFNRYINWEIATSVAWIVIGVILLVISILFWKRFKSIYPRYEKNSFDNECWYWMIFSLIIAAFAVFIIGYQVFDIIRCVYLPELQIYQYVTGLTSNN